MPVHPVPARPPRPATAPTRRPIRHAPQPVAAPRRGTTLAELVVALVIVTVGLLALAGSAAIVARETAAGRRESALAWTARSQLERLASAPCGALVDSSATASGIATGWTLGAAGGGARHVEVTASQPAAAGRPPATLRLRGIVICR